MIEGVLVLSNGRTFRGILRGAATQVAGEVIFNTAMTGYQEILTDPSYAGQIVTMTYPHIGNYGTNGEDVESRHPFVKGFIVKELSPIVSNWRSDKDLDTYLREHGITLLEGVDTRALVIALRDEGAVPGIIAPLNGSGDDMEALVAKAREVPSMEGQNLAGTVSISSPYRWVSGQPDTPSQPTKYRVVAYDFGIKYNILRELTKRGVDVEVVPYDTPAEKVLADKPDGVFLSNGPGDPEPVRVAVDAIQGLLGKVPIFGICLGHQLLGLALGGRSYKLKFGHHGGNHPVQRLETGEIEITSQNHGFALDGETLPDDVEITHLSLNDKTVEGIRSKRFPAFSVQYHPEASPGPHDSTYLFDLFLKLMDE